MSHIRSTQRFSLIHTIRKYLVSAFVVFSFAAYAIHERYNPSAQNDTAALPPPLPTQTRSMALQSQNNAASTVLSEQPSATNLPTDVPTNVPPPTASGQYRDGDYTGNVADAVYGPLQVKAIIRGGKITDVQFLDYPHDRRTSQNINRQAMPYLRYEAIQAQNAQVDIISGATLTSEAFVESLQAALNGAGR